MNRDAGNMLPRAGVPPDELDRGLSRILDGEAANDGPVPSSGFAAQVMESVRDSAVTPEPLPFPWKRALVAFGGALAVLLYAVLRFIDELHRLPPPEHSEAGLHLPAVLVSAATPLGWTALALLVAFASVRFCLRLAAPRG